MKKAAILFIIVTICLMALGGCADNSATGKSSKPDSSAASQGAGERVTIARTSDAQGQFTPIGKDKSYGMILYSSSEISLADESKTATVELFVKAGQVNGKIAWDDGQYWYLIVRDGDSVFKLLDNIYVQNGQVNYWSYWSYNEKVPLLLVMIQEGAGIKEYVYAYDKNKDVFYCDDVFATKGNIGITGSSMSVYRSDADTGK